MTQTSVALASRPARNYGIDLLRIVSMLLVPTLHVLSHGGVLAALVPGSTNEKLVWAIRIAAYCAVNCYALISGYVGLTSRHRYAGVVMLHLQVLFYTFLITWGIGMIREDVLSSKAYLNAAFPVLSGQYWFYTAYVCVSLLAPFLNGIVERLDGKGAVRLCATIGVLFTVLPTFFQRDLFSAGNGYSAIWLMMLYIVGACVRKFDIGSGKYWWAYLGGYAACVLVTWVFKMYTIDIPTETWFAKSSEGALFISYVSPTIALAAVCLLLFFKNLRFPRFVNAIIGFFAPAAFGVYLLHDNLLVRKVFIKDHFAFLATESPLYMLLKLAAVVVGIWLIGSLVDRVRIALFRLLHIKSLLDWCERILTRKKKT